MMREEIIRRSSLRILEQSTKGGIKKGEMGMFASRHGVGKTACLVHIAIDQLLQGKSVIHVSFSDKPSHIIDWYEDIFTTLSEESKLDASESLHDEIVKKRVIMHFSPHVSGEHVCKALRTLIQKAEFDADVLIFDGYDFEKDIAPQFWREIKALAKETNVMVWTSASYHREEQESSPDKLPAYLDAIFDVVDLLIFLVPESAHVQLRLIKDHDMLHPEIVPLILDATTLLIKRE